jgi:polyhydroxybutyrate depolymerase
MTKSRFLGGSTVLALVAAVIEAAAIAQQRSPDPNMTRITAPGDYRFSFSHGGMTRFYLVHVPKSYRPGRATPVLIALHGGGGNADFQADDSKYRLISKSEQSGFIAVFPNGYSRFGGKLATWNAGTCCAGAVRNNVDDVGFIREVIHRVERQASIDPQRVFATGMSNGAMMSWRLACEAPEIRGIAPVEGTDNTTHCTPAHPVPVIQFHALDDPNVPFNGGVGPRSIARVRFTSVPDTQAKWVRLNRANPAARRVLMVTGAHCDLHPATRGGAPVELCVTDTGGHSWPGGGTQQGRKQPSMAISANDLMWSFFSSL